MFVSVSVGLYDWNFAPKPKITLAESVRGGIIFEHKNKKSSRSFENPVSDTKLYFGVIYFFEPGKDDVDASLHNIRLSFIT
jgi:hypothetical protein